MGKVKEEKFYLHDLKDKLDPLTGDQVLTAVKKGSLPFYAAVYEKELKKWIPMYQNKTLASLISMELKVAGEAGASVHSIMGGWFTRDGSQSYGPFSLVQMIELFQQKRVHKESLVQHSKTLTWRKFAEAEPFDDRSIKALFGFPGLKPLFTQRQSPRIAYENSVCLDAGGNVYQGSTWSLSKKGVGVILKTSCKAQVEDQLNLVIEGNDDHGTIQTRGTIVSLHQNREFQRLGLVFDQEIDCITDYIDRCIPSEQTKV